MIKISAICDFCKVEGFEKTMMAKLSLVRSENYLKYNGAKGTFISPIEWDLCPVCYEKITAIIKDDLIKKEIK